MPGSEEVADNAGQVVAVQALRGQVRDSPGRARDEQVLGPAGVRYADRGVVDADVRASGADAPGSRHRELEPERIQETRLVDNGSAGMRDHAIRRAALIRSHPRSEVQPCGPEIAEAVARRAGDPVHPVRGPFQGSCRDQASQVTARHGPSLSLPGCDEPVLGLGKIRHEPEAHRQRHATIVSYSRQACVPGRSMFSHPACLPASRPEAMGGATQCDRELDERGMSNGRRTGVPAGCKRQSSLG
jgi:hypothetical protein